VSCRNWSEERHMTAQMCDQMRWLHWILCRSQCFARNPQGLAVHELGHCR
jgi:hypothetical protein